MKKCPYCAEDIQEAAVKCRYCFEFLDGRETTPARPAASAPATPKTKWYHHKAGTVIAILTFGPFALPIIISNPNYSKTKKTIISTVVIAVTVALCIVIVKIYTHLFETIQSLTL